MKFINPIYQSAAYLLCVIIALSGCVSSDSPKAKRTTLADLANNSSPVELDKYALTTTERNAKLTQIYQQLLHLEPDQQVRTNLEYRLVQINTETFEQQAFGVDDANDTSQSNEALTIANLSQDEAALQQLISEYQNLLQRYPDRPENEHIQYQLAKALDLQGQLDNSLLQMESLLNRYPKSQYLAELNFRRGEIYYNLQNYSAALNAYKQVINADNNQKYLINSMYMSGWSLFKMNQLPQADVAFLRVFETIIAASNQLLNQDSFSFAGLDSRYQNLAIDTQRVLSISLSQQQQAESLVLLIKHNQQLTHLPLYQHVLFDNLANFLLKQQLVHDAELTYQAYISLANNNVWSARYSLLLLNILQQQGKFSAMHQLKNLYIERYGLSSHFWQHASEQQQTELLPNLLKFSDEHSRRLYALAQQMPIGAERVNAFSKAATALATYLQIAKLPQSSQLLTKSLLADEYLYAEANFEAQHLEKALATYEMIAYGAAHTTDAYHAVATVNNNQQNNADSPKLRQQSAYAATITVREILNQLANRSSAVGSEQYQRLISQRNSFDKLFIHYYPQDKRSTQLATHAAQYSFAVKDYAYVKYYSDVVFDAYKLTNNDLALNKAKQILTSNELKQVQVVSQLYAHSLYQQQQYPQAENAYQVALQVTDKSSPSWEEMRDLMASSIYFQALAYKLTQPRLAVAQFLRVATEVPESKYAVTAKFDAANLLLEQQNWQQAVEVMTAFQARYPNHQYSKTIPAKLAQSYEAMGQWELAAEQLLVMIDNESSIALKREAQYTVAEYYLKAGNTNKARLAYRTYANTYPEPFDVAQEVRYKLSEFYHQSNQANKQYYWYRQILKFHQQQPTNTISNRTIELASTAAFGLAQAHQQTFVEVKLQSPLPKSLKCKQQAMKQAIGYYQQVLDFQLAQFVPHATYNLAEMYRQLAYDVMHSQRPDDLDELALEEYDILLEELAYPFEEKAIEIHISNSERAWQNIYDEWVAKSFAQLAKLSPALYNKQEVTHDAIQTIH